VIDPLLRNIRLFYAFRIFFHARFYYPVFAILFLDYGLTIEQFAVLNAVWAATIILLEVPSGAMADTIGRTALLRLASGLMVIEMLLILLAPVGNTTVVFWMFLANRVVSGAAEAFASGADEALAYDSLAATHDRDKWGKVLDKSMRYQSAAFILAMVLGGLLYDTPQLNQWLGQLIEGAKIPEDLTLQLPVLATFFTACGALAVTNMMVDPGKHIEREGVMEEKRAGVAWRRVWSAGRRVLTHPVLFLVILAGLLHDSVIRMILTLNSEYYRLIGIEERYFGLLGAAMAVTGLFMPMVARRLAASFPAPLNFTLVSLITMASFIGLAFAIPIQGLWFILLMMAGFSLLNYFVSFYLNNNAESSERATILSFRGLAYNIGYGVVGLAYAGYYATLPKTDTDSQFGESLWAFPVWFGGTLVLLALVALVLRGRAKEAARSVEPASEK
jgi:MFS family permease